MPAQTRTGLARSTLSLKEQQLDNNTPLRITVDELAEKVSTSSLEDNDEDKENTIHGPVNQEMTYSTPPRPTPYWKVALERGTTSPRITRSASAKKRESNIPRFTPERSNSTFSTSKAQLSSPLPSVQKESSTTPIRETLNCSLTKVKDERVASLEQMVDTVEKENVTLRAEITFLKRERDNDAELQEAQSKVTRFQSSLLEAKEQLRQYNEKILEDERAHEVAEKDAMATIDRLKSTLHHTQEQLNACKQKLETVEFRHEQAIGDTETHQQSITALTKEYENSIELLKRHNEGQVKKVMDKMRLEHNRCVDIVKEKDQLLAMKDSELNELRKEYKKMRLSMETFDSREKSLLKQLEIQDSIRRNLHNRVLQLSGNIKVYIRVRPSLPSEAEQVGECPLTFPPSEEDVRNENVIIAQQPFVDRGGLSSRRKKWKFAFDTVLEPQHDQNDVWTSVQPFVQSAIDGYNVCLFAYGQTGSGKTFTMLGNQANPGITTRVIQNIFEFKQMIETSSERKNRVDVKVELLEVYNECVRDLLSKNLNEVNISMNKSCQESTSNILFDAPDETTVYSIIDKAQKRRCVKATKSNKESSRSHLIFTIHIHLHSDSMSRKGKLNICDLAGSERLSKSESVGSTLKETQHINKSLSSLSNVVEKLQSESKHIPYRDSKLTYLLRDSLGGDSKTLAIVCCNPAESHFQETLCSLRFASKVNRVELRAEKNFSC